MTWLISLGVSTLAGIAGLFLTGLVSSACVSWYHIPSREGASGYFVIFTAIGGGIAAFLIGLVTARLIAANYGPGFGKELGAALGVIFVIASMATLLCRMFADVPPKLDGRELNLEVEFRFPPITNTAQPPTSEGEWCFQLGSLSGHIQRTYRIGNVQTNAARHEDGRWIVPAKTLVFTTRGQRSISLQQGDQSVGGFLVPLPSRPGLEFEQWSDWLPRQQASGQPWPEDKMSYRFRVQKVPLPPPPKSHEEWQVEQDAVKEAEFVTIPADAPVQSWFPYLAYDQPQTERAKQIIAQRPELIQELEKLALGADGEVAYTALRCLSQLPEPTASFIPMVEAAGCDIAQRIQKFNATSVEADPSFEGAADASYRFHGWMEAVRVLRDKCKGDFVPELKTILDFSRIRTDSHAMQADVRRVASFYLNEWAGIAPLPGDPKPR